MNLSDAGARFISQHEGLVLEVYDDPAGYATIGIGHLIAKRRATAADRAQWGRLTEAQVFDLFRSDARRFIDAVAAAVIVPLTQNQFDALVSFAFNIGESAFRQSTLLRKLNAGDYQGAAAEFPKWNKAGGKVLAGLVRRRKEEAELFLRVTAGQAIDIPVAAGSSIKPINGESLEVTHLRGYLKALGVPHRITSTVRDKLPSRHAQKGTNGQGLAVDGAGPKPARNTPEMLAIFQAFEPVEHLLYELIYSGAPYNVKKGKRVPRYAVDDHWDHVHISVEKGVFLPIIETQDEEEGMALVLWAAEGSGETWSLIEGRPCRITQGRDLDQLMKEYRESGLKTVDLGPKMTPEFHADMMKGAQ